MTCCRCCWQFRCWRCNLCLTFISNLFSTFQTGHEKQLLILVFTSVFSRAVWQLDRHRSTRLSQRIRCEFLWHSINENLIFHCQQMLLKYKFDAFRNDLCPGKFPPSTLTGCLDGYWRATTRWNVQLFYFFLHLWALLFIKKVVKNV
jgi:hypothetical protein